MRTAPIFAVTARALARTALWFCASNLLASALAAQCTSPTQVSDGTYTTGDHSASSDNALKAASFVIGGSATATFFAGHCIELDPGFHATAGTVPTTFHAWVDSAPYGLDTSPKSGGGPSNQSTQFTWTASSPVGYQYLTEVQALFTTTDSVSTQNACYIRYNRVSNLFSLADNSGSWGTGIGPQDTTTTLYNNQCIIPPNGWSVSNGSVNQLTLNVLVKFQPTFTGKLYNYLIAYDQAGLTSEWQNPGKATWTVGVPGISLTASPNTFNMATWSNATATYTLTVTPLNGFSGAVSFGLAIPPPGGCGNPQFTPASVSGPPWTTTLTMWCSETYPGYTFTRINAIAVANSGISGQADVFVNVTTTQQYPLNTSISPAVGGSIALSPAGPWYTSGTVVMVTAPNIKGYRFTGFSGALGGMTNPQYVTITASLSVTAAWSSRVKATTGSPSPSGGVSVEPSAWNTVSGRPWLL